MSVRIAATEEMPLVNPCFTVRNWGHNGEARLETTATGVKDVRQGVIVDTDVCMKAYQAPSASNTSNSCRRSTTRHNSANPSARLAALNAGDPVAEEV